MPSITLVQKNKSKGILVWYARVPDPSKKDRNGNTVYHFFSLGTSSKNEAKSMLHDKIRNGDFEIKDERETMTLEEGIVKFEVYQRSKGTKSGSIETMYQAINMLKPIFDMRIAEISANDIAEAFQATADTIAPLTYRNRKTILSTLWNYFVDVLEVAPRNFAKKAIPRRKIPKKHKDFWAINQIDRIISAAPNATTRLVWSLMAFAGLRRREAEAIRPENIYGNFIHLVGKGDKKAKVPICPRLQREIDRYNGDWRLYYSEKTLKRIAQKAIPEGFPGEANAHRFRHSFGSNLIRAGKNIKIVQELMRHESIQLTLDTYGHVLDTDIEKAVCEVYK